MQKNEGGLEIKVEFPPGKETSQVLEVPGYRPEDRKSPDEFLDLMKSLGIPPGRDEDPGVVPLEITIFVARPGFLKGSGNIINVIPYTGQREKQGNRVDGDFHSPLRTLSKSASTIIRTRSLNGVRGFQPSFSPAFRGFPKRMSTSAGR